MVLPANKDEKKKVPRKFRIEIVRENGLIELQKIGFTTIRTRFTANKKAGASITVKGGGFINIAIDEAIKASRLIDHESPVKRITITPDETP